MVVKLLFTRICATLACHCQTAETVKAKCQRCRRGGLDFDSHTHPIPVEKPVKIYNTEYHTHTREFHGYGYAMGRPMGSVMNRMDLFVYYNFHTTHSMTIKGGPNTHI